VSLSSDTWDALDQEESYEIFERHHAWVGFVGDHDRLFSRRGEPAGDVFHCRLIDVAILTGHVSSWAGHLQAFDQQYFNDHNLSGHLFGYSQLRSRLR
jgi:hypothetical protein